ncbi:MAG: ParA family protein [Armatimonadetes bacterium]|nr:ParA family protein [Armatimonadota bacterium]
MAHIVAVVNQKGGVGKTTTAVNLAAGLAALGYKTLLIDADAQANATSGVGAKKEGATLFEALTGEAEPKEAIVATAIENLFLSPASIDLAGFDVIMANQPERELRLRSFVNAVKPEYDWIVIDAPPSLSLMTINAMAACNGLIVPIQCEYYALEGLASLIRTVDLVARSINPNLSIWKALLTMRDPRTKLAQHVESEIRAYLGQKVSEIAIPRNIKASESPSFGQPLVVFAPKSPAARAYVQFSKEVAELGTSRIG